MRTLIVAAIAAIAAIVVATVLIAPADAHWTPPVGTKPDPQVEQWYAAQHNAHGDWCCDKADGHDFYGSYSFDPDGGVSFKVGGVQYRLPAYMVLKAANPTGHAVWWYVTRYDGVHVDYCFAPGAAG